MLATDYCDKRISEIDIELRECEDIHKVEHLKAKKEAYVKERIKSLTREREEIPKWLTYTN